MNKLLNKFNKFSNFLLVTLFTFVIYAIIGHIVIMWMNGFPKEFSFWPSAGIALVAAYVFGSRVWLGLFLGSLFSSLTFVHFGFIEVPSLDIGVAISILFSIGSTLQAIIGASLIKKYVPDGPLYNVKSGIRFILLSSIIALIVPLSGTLGYLFFGIGPFGVSLERLIYIWLGGVTGVYVVAPFCLSWSKEKSINISYKKILEGLIAVLVIIFVSEIIFGSYYNPNITGTFLFIPLFSWIAIRFGNRILTTLVTFVILYSIIGTMNGQGPFALEEDPYAIKASLEIFIIMISLMSYIVKAALNGYMNLANQAHIFKSRYKAILQAQSELICRYTIDFKLTFVNDAFCEFYGKSRKDLIGQHIKTLLSDADFSEVTNKINRFMKSPNEKIVDEYKTVDSKGHVRYHRWTDIAILDNFGQLAEIQGVCSDITDIIETKRMLKKSEALAKKLIESNIIGVSIWDNSGKIIDANDYFLNITGYNHDDLQNGKIDWRKISLDMEGQSIHNLSINEIDKFENNVPIEEFLVKKDGSKAAVFSSRALFPGNLSQGISFVFDRSSEKEAKKKLKITSERFNHLVKNSPVAIYSLNLEKVAGYKNFNCDFVSENIKSITGYSVKEALNNPDFFPNLLHKDDKEQIIESFNQLIINGSQVVEYRILNKNGDIRWVRDEAKVIYDEENNPQEIVGNLLDITSRKVAEEELKHAYAATSQALNKEVEKNIYTERMKNRLVTILDTTPDFVGITSVDNEILYLNKAAKNLLAVETEDNLSEINTSKLIPKWTQKLFVREIKPSLLKHGIWSGQTAIYDNDKNEVPFSQISIAHKDSNGKVEFLSTIARDISETKKNEETLIKIKEEANLANKTKSEFLANMSHEIRTPLGVLLGYSELLSKPEIHHEEKKKYQKVINRNGQNLLSLIDDILDLSKVESGYLMHEEKRFNLINFTRNIITEMQMKAEVKGLKLYMSFNGHIPQFIRSDQMRLKQILINMISNAIKFTVSGHVHIRIYISEEENEKLVFDIKDTGCGIYKRYHENLFMPFTQGDSSVTRKYGGTGLGLALSRHLAQMLGGDITLISSKKNLGSTFRVEIDPGPLSKVRLVRSKNPALELNGAKKLINNKPLIDEKLSLKGARILLIEDYVDNQTLMTAVLSRKGSIVDVAENGKVGIAKVAEGNYDMIFMDIQMPIMNGYDATKKLRELGFSMPIIALTAHAMDGEREKCIRCGCTDFLSKPAKPNDLIEMAKKYYYPFNRNNIKSVDDNFGFSKQRIFNMSTRNNEILMSSFSDDPVINVLLPKFISNLSLRIEKLNNQINNNDWQGIKSLAHQLKGACAGYGYDCMTELANTIEIEALEAKPSKLKLIELAQKFELFQSRAKTGLKELDIASGTL